jgi:hypothetical protein
MIRAEARSAFHRSLDLREVASERRAILIRRAHEKLLHRCAWHPARVQHLRPRHLQAKCYLAPVAHGSHDGGAPHGGA